MEVLIEIKRQESAESKPYFQSIRLNLERENLTVASLLREINAKPEIKDIEGKPVSEKMWSLCHAYKWKAKACLRCISKGLC